MGIMLFTMPYHCNFCGKMCATPPSLERHIARSPNCKKAYLEQFGEYAKSIWDDVPANPIQVDQQPPENLSDWPDFRLEEDIQRVEDMLYDEETDLLQQPPPPPQDEPEPNPLPATAEHLENNKEVGLFIENFPEKNLAGATWGCHKSLFECIDEAQKSVGSSCWAPFEDEDEWQLAEWLIHNVGQKQTDSFLKLPIVSKKFSLFLCII